MSFLADRSAVSIGLGGIPSLRSGTGGLNPSLDLDFAVSKSLDPRITFTRASEARYYDASTVAVAEQNLLLQSQTFDNASWIKTNATVTANSTTAPDGTTTADTLLEAATTTTHTGYQTVSVAAAQYFFSVYLKDAGRSFALVAIGVNAVSVNLTLGTVSAANGTTSDRTIQSVGGGWYRVSFSVTTTAGNNDFVIYTSTDGVWANRVYAGDITKGLYLWGAQLEQRSSVTAYTPTTTAAVTNYIPVLQVAPINLLTYSEEFDNAAWVKTNVTVSANAIVSPDGTVDAEKLVEASGSSAKYINQSATLAATTSYTQTVYAKAAGRGVLQITSSTNLSGSGTTYQNFDLINGTLGSSNGGKPATITPVGDGWYRCSYTDTSLSAASGQFVMVIVDSATATRLQAYTGDGTSGIYIWGAQLQTGSSAGAYARTTNVSTGAPRFDHNPVTRESLGLLIEEQRTNLLLRSEEFNNAAWTKTNSTINANAVVSPDGTVDADELVDNTTSGAHTVEVTPTVTSGASYTLSVYAKAYTLTKLMLQLDGNGTVATSTFNLSNGTVESTLGGSATITAVGNGWYRCAVTGTTVNTTPYIRIRLVNAASSPTYAGTGQSLFIWGAQLEAGAFATSYIPTVASQVTRSADAASMTGTNFSSWYRQDEGTIYSDASLYGYTSPRMIVCATDGTTSNIIQHFYNSAASLRSSVVSATVVQSELTRSSVTLNANYKMATALRLNDFALSVNGEAVLTATSGTMPVSLTTLGIGNRNGLLIFNGTIKKIAYYPQRLADATLQSLTA